MPLTERCSECGKTFRQHRRHKIGSKRHAQWCQSYPRGMRKISEGYWDSRKPKPTEDIMESLEELKND